MNRSESMAVLSFWFSNGNKQKWFAKDNHFDHEIISKFCNLYNNVTTKFDCSNKSPEEILAAIIVLDQFSRNMFRGIPKAFAADKQALALTKYSIQKAIDQQLSDEYKHFLYMPLMHSENLEDQELCIKLFAFDRKTYEYAKLHRDIIKLFGRFPHRNEILGRKSTKKELEFLKQNNSSF